MGLNDAQKKSEAGNIEAEIVEARMSAEIEAEMAALEIEAEKAVVQASVVDTL